MFPDLDRLAELVGFEPTYRDFFGNAPHVSARDEARLLTPLGFRSKSRLPQPRDGTNRDLAADHRPGRRRPRGGDGPSHGRRLPVGDHEDRLDARRRAWPHHARRAHVYRPLAARRPPRSTARLMERRVLDLAVPSTLGYHRLTLNDAEGNDVAETTVIVAPHALLRSPRRGTGGQGRGGSRPAVRTALQAKLGHRRLYGFTLLDRDRRRPRRSDRRPQSAPRARSSKPGRRQSLQPLQPLVPQRRLPRSRGDFRVRDVCGSASVRPTSA